MNGDGSRTGRTDAEAARWVARRDAGLSAAEVAEMAAWLAADPSHAASLERYERIWRVMGRTSRGGTGMALLAELRRQSAARLRRRMAAAGALLAAVLLAVGVWPRREGAGRAVAAKDPVRVKVVAPTREVLPDGTIMEHLPDTLVKTDYSPAVRRVRLARGEALFTVTKDAARPFVVNAAGIEVRAVGTAFSVELEDKGVEVLVTEGRVRVDKSGASSAPTSPSTEAIGTVGAGQCAFIARDATVAAVVDASAADMAARLAWRGTCVEFSGATLTEVVDVLNRHSGKTYIIDDSALGGLALSGRFYAEDTAAVTGALSAGFGIRAQVAGPEVRLQRNR